MQPPLFVAAAKGFVAAFTGDILLKVLGLAATFFVLHELSPYEYGQWQLLLSVVTAFASVMVPGIASMLVADISREIGSGQRERANGITIRAASLSVTLGASGALLMFLGAPLVYRVTGIDFTWYIRLLALSVLVMGFKQAYMMVLHAHLHFGYAQIIKSLDRTAYVGLIILFLPVLGWGFTGVVYAYIMSAWVSVLVFAPYMAKLFIDSFRNRDASHARPFWEAAWVRGKWAVSADLTNAGTGSLWPWVVGYFLSIEIVGLISVTMLLLGQVAAFVPVAYVLRSVLPRTAETPERMREWLGKSLKISFWGHLIAGLAAFAACAILFPWRFPEYMPSLALFAALLITLPLRGVTSASGEWFYAARKQREFFFVSTMPKLALFVVLPLFLAGGVLGYLLWYITSAVVVLAARLPIIRREVGVVPSARDILAVRASDLVLVERVITLVRAKVRHMFSIAH